MSTSETRRKNRWLLVDAVGALTDQAFDMLMLHVYATNGDWEFFSVGVGSILIPALLTGFGYGYGPSTTPCCGLLNFVPGLNLMIAAFHVVSLKDGGERHTRAQKDRDSAEGSFTHMRTFEALFEAAPQAILQAYVALRRPEGTQAYILFPSLALSLFSVTKTLVSFFIFLDFGKTGAYYLRHYHNRFQSSKTRLRMFMLSVSYELSEVLSRVSTIALFGCFCGGYFIPIALGAECVLMFLYINITDSFQDQRWRHKTPGTSYFLLPFTSFACGPLFPFQQFLALRFIVLIAYAVFPIWFQQDDTSFTGIVIAFCAVGVVATVLWVLLMPAFVNSYSNLDLVLFAWVEDGYKPDRFTKRHYPLEVKNEPEDDIEEQDDTNKGGCCCKYINDILGVTNEGADVAINVVEVAGAG